MTTLTPRANAKLNITRPFPRPDDFTATEPCSLAEAVQAAVHTVEEGTVRPAARDRACPVFQPRMLLGLLSYCYARQTYGSVEIEAALQRDMFCRQFCHNELPDARTLRRFRRENREALQRCLTAALRFLGEQKVAAGLVTRVSEAQLAEEASRRIIMAMFVDSMEADENQNAEAVDGDQAPDAPVDLCYLFAKGGARGH